jgi:hypothetical protein
MNMINITTAGDNVVVAGISGQVITVYSLFFQCGAATTITFKSGSTSLTGPMAFIAGGGFNLFFGDSIYIFTCGVGQSFIINTSGLLPQVGGALLYTQG